MVPQYWSLDLPSIGGLFLYIRRTYVRGRFASLSRADHVFPAIPTLDAFWSLCTRDPQLRRHLCLLEVSSANTAHTPIATRT